MVVPLTLATFRGTLVRVSEQLFVLPSTNVERVARAEKEAIQTVENREPFFSTDSRSRLSDSATYWNLKRQAIGSRSTTLPCKWWC